MAVLSAAAVLFAFSGCDEPKEDNAGTLEALKITGALGDARYQFTIDGFEVEAEEDISVTIKYPSDGQVTSAFLRASDDYTKYTTKDELIESGVYAGWHELTAVAAKTTNGLLITLNGTFPGPEVTAYIADITIGDYTVDLCEVTNKNDFAKPTSLTVVDVNNGDKVIPNPNAEDPEDPEDPEAPEDPEDPNGGNGGNEGGEGGQTGNEGGEVTGGDNGGTTGGDEGGDEGGEPAGDGN